MLSFSKQMVRCGAFLAALMLPALCVSSCVLGQNGKLEGMQEEKGAQSNSAISEEGKRRIAALVADKEQRTAAERKIDSRLLAVINSRRGLDAGGASEQRLGIPVDAQGRCLVDMNAVVSEKLLKDIGNFGGAVLSSFKQFNAVRALVPVEALTALAADPAVKFIRPAEEAQTDNAIAPGASEPLSETTPGGAKVDAGQSGQTIKESVPAKARRRPRRHLKSRPR